MVEASNRNWRLLSQTETATWKWTQNHRLGEVSSVCGRVWQQNSGRNGGALVWTNQCADDFSCLASYWVYAKKKTYGYIERDEVKRQAFVEQLAAVPVSQRVYVDEAGMDSRDEYSYGWNQRGERFHALKTGRRSGRVNMIAAWCAQHLLAPFTVDGACNRVGERNLGRNLLSPHTTTMASCDFG